MNQWPLKASIICANATEILPVQPMYRHRTDLSPEALASAFVCEQRSAKPEWFIHLGVCFYRADQQWQLDGFS
jgi:hypothetical protein